MALNVVTDDVHKTCFYLNSPVQHCICHKLWILSTGAYFQCNIIVVLVMIYSEQSNRTPRCSQEVRAAGLPWLEFSAIHR